MDGWMDIHHLYARTYMNARTHARTRFGTYREAWTVGHMVKRHPPPYPPIFIHIYIPTYVHTYLHSIAIGAAPSTPHHTPRRAARGRRFFLRPARWPAVRFDRLGSTASPRGERDPIREPHSPARAIRDRSAIRDQSVTGKNP